MQHNVPETVEWQDTTVRIASEVLTAKIHSIERAEGGLFGLLKSPSIVTGPSDPVWVTFTLADNTDAPAATPSQVKMKLLKAKLGTLREGDAVQLDMATPHICIGISAAKKR